MLSTGILKWMRKKFCRLWTSKKNKKRHTLSPQHVSCLAYKGTEFANCAVINSIHVCRLNHHLRPVPPKTWPVIEI